MKDREKWVRVTHSENVPPRQGRSIDLGGHQIALFNLGDRFLAVEDKCPHRGGPLSDGILAGESVVCPLHAWRVSLGSGQVTKPLDAMSCVRTYATHVEDGIVYIQISEGAATSLNDGVLSCSEIASAEGNAVAENTW